MTKCMINNLSMIQNLYYFNLEVDVFAATSTLQGRIACFIFIILILNLLIVTHPNSDTNPKTNHTLTS